MRNINGLFRTLALGAGLLSCLLSCGQPGKTLGSRPADRLGNEVTLGDERFEEYIPGLKNKRVAVFSNHTGMVGNKVTDKGLGPHVVDALIEKGVDVRLIFSPEHGFRGDADAGEMVESGKDPKTGVEIVSLFGALKYPRPEDMTKFDALLVDIQDVGLRYYTYYITMSHLMESCAASGKKVIVLDRPNPNGFYVDGPVLEPEYKSGVGTIPVPVRAGLKVVSNASSLLCHALDIPIRPRRGL